MLHLLCLTVFAAHADSGKADLHAALPGELTVTELFQFSTDFRKRIRIHSLPGRLYHIHRDPQNFRSFQFLLVPSGASAVLRDHVADIVLLQDSGIHFCGKRSLQCQDLSAFDSLAIDSQIRDQEAFAQVKDIQKNYPVSEDEGEEDNTYLSYNMVVGEAADINLSLAFEVLDYALLSAPGAPLKQALLDAKIGKDIYGSFEDGI